VAEKIEFELSIGKNELDKALKGATAEAAKTEKAVNSISVAFKGAGNEISRLKASFIGNLGANIVSSSLSLVASAFKDIIKEGREFSRVIAEINSTLPKNAKLTNDQALALAKVSERFGTTATAQAKGFFEVVSNGVEDASTAFNILTNANNAALSGLVDVNTATKLITTTFNAYKNSSTTVAEVTDTLVAVTQASGARFEELANSMGRVTNVAAQSGISIGELGGTIAFLNARSLTTEQAITGIAGAVTSISKPSQDASNEAARLGLNFNATALKAKGLAGFLEDVAVKTGGNITSLRRLFPEQRAANAVIAIATSKFSDYASVVDKVTNSQGEAARAAKIIKESLDFRLSELSSQFNGLAIAIGQQLTPVLIGLASGLRALKDSLEDGPKSIDENRNKLNALSKEYNNTKNAIDILSNASGASDRQLLAASSTIGSVANGQKRLNEILKERAVILSSTKPISDVITPPIVDAEVDQAAVDSRRESFNQLAIARTDFDAFNAQLDADSRALSFENNQADLDALREFEVAKIDASLQAEIEKTNLIQDEKARRDGLDALDFKKASAVRKLDAKRDLDGKKAQIALEQTFQNQKNDIIGSSFGLASALAKDGSKAQFLIQKAGALAQIALARGTAIGLIPAQTAFIPYPANLAASAQLLANANIQAGIGAATVAASAIKGFANGGIVGSGATAGPDNQLATVRTGELILNADQQKNLFDAINSGNLGGGGDIVIQIDGRTIATAVRNQVKSGFVLA
jgi:TP901 family phage tail tape measure protein